LERSRVNEGRLTAAAIISRRPPARGKKHDRVEYRLIHLVCLFGLGLSMVVLVS
jgi:hypothetical protein